MANPTFDEAWTHVTSEINRGAEPFAVDQDAHAHVKGLIRPSFVNRLDQLENVWEDEKQAVLNAAFQLGKVAAALTSVGRGRSVSLGDLELAARTVSKKCNLGVLPGEGRWCSL